MSFLLSTSSRNGLGNFSFLLVVSVLITEGYVICMASLTLYIHTRLMLLHDSRNDDGIKSFFQEVHELYIKVKILLCEFYYILL